MIKRIVADRVIYNRRKARKTHLCKRCGREIKPGDEYWTDYPVGSGMQGLKFPDRFCDVCMAPIVERQGRKEVIERGQYDGAET